MVKFHVFCAWNNAHLALKGKNPEAYATIFKHTYPRCHGIIDASEIKTEAPSSLVLNSELYSLYKNHTTVKGNNVISPGGEVIHVSSLFSGSISDKDLVKRSGVSDLLEPNS